MPAWLIWAIAAALLSVGELLTPGMFFLGPVALAAIASAVVALADVGVVGQLLVFIVGAIGSVWFLRPIARRHLHMPAALRTGTAALEGTKAVVLQRVDMNGGRVRIGGEEWSARAYLEDQVLEPGARVEVVKIEGATALVYQ
ncbi:MAG: NfeD family protein [Actinobacteria bacterium]|nr:MAG: NfeD family protein [Actinomycetota bacterium]